MLLRMYYGACCTEIGYAATHLRCTETGMLLRARVVLSRGMALPDHPAGLAGGRDDAPYARYTPSSGFSRLGSGAALAA
eukprot:1493332-Rhodomonas_salina.1